MVNLKKWIIGIGLALIVFIVLLIVIPIEEGLEGQLFYGIHLILITIYVFVTYYLVSVNEKLVSTHKENLCLQNTPVVTAEMRSQLELLEITRMITDDDKADIENINTAKIILHNPTKNNAMGVRVTMIAYVNNSRINSSPPLDGSTDWHVQAGHRVVKAFKMQDDYLNTANCTIQSMAEEMTEANRKTQFVLNVQLSYLDGCGRKIEQPVLSWYFDFKDMKWHFVI